MMFEAWIIQFGLTTIACAIWSLAGSVRYFTDQTAPILKAINSELYHARKDAERQDRKLYQ